ncbi:MAG: nucleotidyltransferase domain-containing protein [Aquificota bacterium]|nr:nucleotidyltransferase domain-containing protein [Aquificota bacterium]
MGYSPEDYMDMVGRAIVEALGGADCIVVFFGTVVGGSFDRCSDIDVGVFCGRELTPEEYGRVLDRLEELPILREVDLVDLARVNDREFLKAVVEGGKVWKGSEGLLRSLKERLRDTRRS